MHKKENIFEISVLGIVPFANIEIVKLTIEENFENIFVNYKYDISTYKLEFNDGIRNINNIIELHQNISDSYEK